MAEFLAGFPRYPKMHPCGVVLSRQPLQEVTPCFTSRKNYPATHYDMEAVEGIGLVVCEEHILQICVDFAGMAPCRADMLRRALVKQKFKEIAKIGVEFIKCTRAAGREDADIERVWELVTGFNGYAFNKAHSTA